MMSSEEAPPRGKIRWEKLTKGWAGGELTLGVGPSACHIQLMESNFRAGLFSYSTSTCCSHEVRFITPMGNPGRVARCQKCGREDNDSMFDFSPQVLPRVVSGALAKSLGVNLTTASLWALHIVMWLEEEGPMADLRRWRGAPGSPGVERRGFWEL